MAMGRFCVGAAFVVAIWMTEVSCASFGGSNGRSEDEIGLGNVPQNDLADVLEMQQLIEALYQDHYIIEDVSQTSLCQGCRKHYKAIGLLKAISNYKDVKEVSRESDQVNAEASSGTDPKAVGAALDANDLAALNNVLTG
ncbi:unnamed protein product [Boreogadus saida]